MRISDRDLEAINGALTLAIMRAAINGNDEAEEIFKEVSIRVSHEIQRREFGPFTLAEARDANKWYRRIGDAKWRREINGEIHCKIDAPGARAFRDDDARWVEISDAAAADWEVLDDAI